MFNFFSILHRQGKGGRSSEIDPDEIFLDASNLPKFDRHQFEGRLEKPIPKKVVISVGIFFLLVLLIFLSKALSLQVWQGDLLSKQSEQNHLRHTLIFGERGVFYDRNGELLAYNVSDPTEPEFSKRKYSARQGIGNLLGFLKYPSKDSSGFYYKVDFEGMDGVEKELSEYVAPEHGLKIIETDVFGKIQSESVQKPPKDGASVTLSVDARLSEKLYQLMDALSKEKKFDGGAAVIIDVGNGEILSMVDFPEYDPQTLTDGKDTALISRTVSDPRKPFLNRATDGLYTPGSIVKPFVALGALEEGVISPEKTIVSTGSISVPNPFDPAHPSVFNDWKAHGAVDMRKALAVSSDVYFYEIGGGFEGQRGLGIGNIEKYMRLFGFGAEPSGNISGKAGVIPDPEWKRRNFNGEAWRVGDTYHTAIGQYGFQVTPLQVADAIAAIANGGKLFEPRIVHDDSDKPVFRTVPAGADSFQIVREGMRQAVESGTASGLNIPQVSVAAKTGTAELGTVKKLVNSWVTGFFPYENPHYAFAIIMEKGPRDNTVGALYVMRQFLEWMSVNTPEYLKNE